MQESQAILQEHNKHVMLGQLDLLERSSTDHLCCKRVEGKMLHHGRRTILAILW